MLKNKINLTAINRWSLHILLSHLKCAFIKTLTFSPQMNLGSLFLLIYITIANFKKEPAKRNTIYLYGFKFKWGHVLIAISTTLLPPTEAVLVWLLMLLECFISNIHYVSLIGEVFFRFCNEQPSSVIII